MKRVWDELAALWADARRVPSLIRRDRAIAVVIVLSVLPWVITLIHRRDPNIWVGPAEILAIIVVYWFLTRRSSFEFLPVRTAPGEALIGVSLVVLWILYRLVQYNNLLHFPAIQLAICNDLADTIVPKTLEMVLAPLVLFLLLPYSPRELGFGLPLRSWVPGLLPLLALTAWGLSRHSPQELATRTLCFYLGAGLPEEFLFRGILQSRFEVLTKSPAWGLLLGGLVFGASHLPIDLHATGMQNWPIAFETAFTYQMGIGLALGYAFQRVRNLWPLTLIHALIDAAPLV